MTVGGTSLKSLIPSRTSKIRTVLRVTSGNFLEQFDFFLFGFYATSISKAFFPAESEFASLMLTFTVFGVGFLMRPLGAIVLGGYIDKVGRRKGLIVTLSIMASGTILIALVPDYATIGMLASFLVLVGRIMQGFSAGAEMGGVSVYLAEIATPNHRGFYTSWQSASQQMSIVAAAAIGALLNQWMAPAMVAEWGWRIPFILGSAIVPFIYVLRRNLRETDAFLSRQHHPDAREMLTSLITHWKTIIIGTLLVAMTTCTFYLITVYTPTFGRSVLHLSTMDSLLVTLCVGLSNFIWLPIGGALSDRIGRKHILMTISFLAMVTAYPFLSWLAAAPSFEHMLAVLLCFSFYFGVYNGAMVATLTEIMPTHVRVVGFSLAFSLATAIFGGFTPAISTFLIDLTGDKAAPGYWMGFSALCGGVATWLLYRQGGAGNRSVLN